MATPMTDEALKLAQASLRELVSDCAAKLSAAGHPPPAGHPPSESTTPADAMTAYRDAYLAAVRLNPPVGIGALLAEPNGPPSQPNALAAPNPAEHDPHHPESGAGPANLCHPPVDPGQISKFSGACVRDFSYGAYCDGLSAGARYSSAEWDAMRVSSAGAGYLHSEPVSSGSSHAAWLHSGPSGVIEGSFMGDRLVIRTDDGLDDRAMRIASGPGAVIAEMEAARGRSRRGLSEGKSARAFNSLPVERPVSSVKDFSTARMVVCLTERWSHPSIGRLIAEGMSRCGAVAPPGSPSVEHGKWFCDCLACRKAQEEKRRLAADPANSFPGLGWYRAPAQQRIGLFLP